jgi:hypothetical protein
MNLRQGLRHARQACAFASAAMGSWMEHDEIEPKLLGAVDLADHGVHGSSVQGRLGRT